MSAVPASPEGPDEGLRDAIEDKIANPWSVACPKCGAAEWTSCKDMHEAHVARSALAVLPLLTAEREREIEGYVVWPSWDGCAIHATRDDAQAAADRANAYFFNVDWTHEVRTVDEVAVYLSDQQNSSQRYLSKALTERDEARERADRLARDIAALTRNVPLPTNRRGQGPRRPLPTREQQ